MKPSRLLRLLLIGTALLSLAASVFLIIEKRRIESSLSTLSATRAALENRLHQKRPQHPSASLPSPEHFSPALDSTDSSTLSSPALAPSPETPSLEPLSEELTLQTLQLISARASFPTRYAPFLRTQPLSDTQLSALEELLSRREEQRLDLAAVIRSHRLPDSDPAITSLRTQTEREFRQNLSQLIGVQPAENLAEFERKLPAWELVGNFAGASALEGRPLTPDQATELAEVIASASPSYQAGNDVAPSDVNWPAVITQTATVLTPPQALSFRNMAPRYPIENPVPTSGR